MLAKKLLMVVPAPIIQLSEDKLLLDKKFVAGMLQHLDHWDGRIGCIMRCGAPAIPFAAEYERASLPFDITILEQGQRLQLSHLEGWDIALLSGDSVPDLLSPAEIRASDPSIFYGIEYTLRTRQDIIRVETASAVKTKYRLFRTLLEEHWRRRAFASANGIQANGYPAYQSYEALNSNTMLYLDNRMTNAMFASPAMLERRKARIESEGRLRLVHSGRLEKMKGGHHLLPFAEALHEMGVDYRLDIYGSGSLADEIAQRITTSGLSERVAFHGPVDFDTQLVRMLKEEADIFVSCHLQSDPSCTYIESLGCGVPIVGYENAMWSQMLKNSRGGWSVPPGQPKALAQCVRALNTDRQSIIARAFDGWSFAKCHDFHSEFRNRMEHLSKPN